MRVSPDDILRLPVHRAINLWVADGEPRSGFLAQTLPMEPLFDQVVADEHRAKQRERGGHFPETLPSLLPEEKAGPSQPTPSASRRRITRGATHVTGEQTQIEGLGT